MMTDATKQFATAHDVMILVTEMTILGRALVASGLLRKDDIYKQIDFVLPAMDHLMKVELENFRRTVEKWPSPTQQ
jgi:hypothetical protein